MYQVFSSGACTSGYRLPLTSCLGATPWLWHPFTSIGEEMRHLPGSVRGQILPGEGGRGSACTPAQLWRLSKASSSLLRRHPAGECTCPGERWELAAYCWCCLRCVASGRGAGRSTCFLAGDCRGNGRDFPLSSLFISIQWKESQEKPLLPAWSREQCWAAARGQSLLQVSEPSSLGPLRVREGPCFIHSCWQVWGLLQTYF